MISRPASSQHLADLVWVYSPVADPGITDDERQMMAEMMAQGTYVVQKPIDQPYDVSDCAVRDPAGNLICVQEQS